MLHLVFCDNGLDRIRDTIKGRDKVVQLNKDRILLVDTAKYLQSIKELAPQKVKKNMPKSAGVIEGDILSQRELATLISDATSIKTTF